MCAGVDCPSCNIRLFQCPTGDVPGPCVIGSPTCLTPFSPPTMIVTFNGMDMTSTIGLIFPAPDVMPGPIQFYQLYVGGVGGCPIVNAAGCPLTPFCCNFNIEDAG